MDFDLVLPQVAFLTETSHADFAYKRFVVGMRSDVVLEVAGDPKVLVAVLVDALQYCGFLVEALMVHVEGDEPAWINFVHCAALESEIPADQNVLALVVDHTPVQCLFFVFEVTDLVLTHHHITLLKYFGLGLTRGNFKSVWWTN